MQYYLVHGSIPVEATNLEVVRLKYRTDNIIPISKSVFIKAECDFYIYLSNLSKLLNKKIKNK